MASCFLFYLAHCSKYCWLNFVFVQGSEFGLAAMAEVVVERPETIFIGTANQVAKGVEHVWRYKLTFVGAGRMYVCMEPPSTTHAGDLMFIMEEVVEGNKWYVLFPTINNNCKLYIVLQLVIVNFRAILGTKQCYWMGE